MKVEWEQIQALFDEASALPERQRESFLRSACGDDVELLAELRSLLACDQSAPPAFLESQDNDSTVFVLKMTTRRIHYLARRSASSTYAASSVVEGWELSTLPNRLTRSALSPSK
jgi:hypothetical protein